MTRYRVTMKSGYRWTFSANLAEASAPLYLYDGDGEPVQTPYQTADAQHRVEEAAAILWPIEIAGDGEDPDDDKVASVRALD